MGVSEGEDRKEQNKVFEEIMEKEVVYSDLWPLDRPEIILRQSMMALFRASFKFFYAIVDTSMVIIH